MSIYNSEICLLGILFNSRVGIYYIFFCCTNIPYRVAHGYYGGYDGEEEDYEVLTMEVCPII